jgi:hypothetical protein
MGKKETVLPDFGSIFCYRRNGIMLSTECDHLFRSNVPYIHGGREVER